MSAELKEGVIIPFEVTKLLKYIKKLGFGGTGDTHLFLDETTDKYFAIKKYVPKGNNDIDECFERFVDEIKILLDVNHTNIVRVYHYYLYPKYKQGYLEMEYIDGYAIDKFKETEAKTWNDLFIDAINAFEYLEKKGILHRDIRPSNFMITGDNVLKVIDFGFGKKINSENINENSILLNWPVTKEPEEIVLNGNYDVRTDIYYLGNMFKKLVSKVANFNYVTILEQMSEVSLDRRFKSFGVIKASMNETFMAQIDFTKEEKNVYIAFADALMAGLGEFTESPIIENDIQKVLVNLENVIKRNSLEEQVQGVVTLIKCFVLTSKFSYKPNARIQVEEVKKFYQLLTKIDMNKKIIVLQNIINRLSTVPVNESIEYDLPF